MTKTDVEVFIMLFNTQTANIASCVSFQNLLYYMTKTDVEVFVILLLHNKLGLHQIMPLTKF